MTKSIYIRGDMEIYDAATHKQLKDIIAAAISFGPAVHTAATLTYGCGTKETVALLPSPVRSFDLTIEESPDSVGQATIIRATLSQDGANDLLASNSLSHQEELGVCYDIKADYRLSILRRVVEPLLQELAKTPPVTGGGYASHGSTIPFPPSSTCKTMPQKRRGQLKPVKVYNGMPPPPTVDKLDVHNDAPGRVCQECGGSGTIDLFNGTVPCSTCGKDQGNTVALQQGNHRVHRKGQGIFSNETNYGGTAQWDNPKSVPLADILDAGQGLKDFSLVYPGGSPGMVEPNHFPYIPGDKGRTRHYLDNVARFDARYQVIGETVNCRCIVDGKALDLGPGKLVVSDEAYDRVVEHYPDWLGHVTRWDGETKHQEVPSRQQSRSAFTKSAEYRRLADQIKNSSLDLPVEHCSECGGTGEIQMFTSVEKCSCHR